MLNEEKIRLMARMASYEEHEGKRDLSIASYFRGDYISFQLLKSAIYATVGFALAVVLYVLYDFQTFLEDFYKMYIVGFLNTILSKYVFVLAVYLVISYFVYAFRYSRAKRHIKKYQSQLKQLQQMYNIAGRKGIR